MSIATLNGAPVLGAEIHLPLNGAWVADLEMLDEPTAAAGSSVSIVIGSQTFVGTVHRVSTYQGRGADVRVVGGAGQLSTVLRPRQFRSPTAQNVIDAALREAPEVLGGNNTTGLSTSFAHWERSSRTLGQELDRISSVLGTTWRIQPDGTLQIGEVTTGAADVDDYTIVHEDSRPGRIVIAADDPTVLPGQTFEGITVSNVLHRVSERGIRTEVYDSDGLGRLVGMLDSITHRANPTDLHAFYECDVVSQNNDGTFELKPVLGPAADRLPDLSRVPYRPATPGMTYSMTSGTCLVGFAGGDERAPYVAAWLTGTPTEVAVPVSSVLELGAASGGQFVAVESLVSAELSTLKSAISSAVVVAGDGGASLKADILLALAGWPSSMAATKVKAT